MKKKKIESNNDPKFHENQLIQIVVVFFSSANHKPPQQQQQQQYFDQYENYARPTAQATHSYNHNSMNNINNNHANVSLAYNNAHTVQGYSSNSHTGNNHVYNADVAHNPNAMPIGKISDYDPITDGPRNIPNTTRPSSTLIYSSDRGMGKQNIFDRCILSIAFLSLIVVITFF